MIKYIIKINNAFIEKEWISLGSIQLTTDKFKAKQWEKLMELAEVENFLRKNQIAYTVLKLTITINEEDLEN